MQLSRCLFLLVLRVLLVVPLATALTGCPGPTFVVQQYAGPVRPKESIATLRVKGSDSLRLATLDDQDLGGTPIEVDARLHIELLPGRHALTVLNTASPQTAYAPIAFMAEAGKVYRATFVLGEPRVYEVDGGDRTGIDVTK